MGKKGVFLIPLPGEDDNMIDWQTMKEQMSKDDAHLPRENYSNSPQEER